MPLSASDNTLILYVALLISDIVVSAIWDNSSANTIMRQNIILSRVTVHRSGWHMQPAMNAVSHVSPLALHLEFRW